MQHELGRTGQPSLTGLGSGAGKRLSDKAREELCRAWCRGRCWDAVRWAQGFGSARPSRARAKSSFCTAARGRLVQRCAVTGRAWTDGFNSARAAHACVHSSLGNSACAARVPALARAAAAGPGGEMCRRLAPRDLQLPTAPSPAGEGWVLCRHWQPQLLGCPPPRAPAPGGPRDAC